MSAEDIPAARPWAPGTAHALARSVLAGSLGGLLFGFDTAVISGATASLTTSFHLSPALLGITVSVALWGSIVGALTAGQLGERIGGRGALLLMAALYLASAIGCATAWNWPTLLALRFIGGLGIGGSSVLGPVYLAEISPPRWRGRLVGLFQLDVVLGILFAYLSNFCIALLHLGNAEWRFQLAVPALPALLFLLLVLVIPQSPRWLVGKGQVDEAVRVLRQLGSPHPEHELRDIIASLRLNDSETHEPLFSRKYALPLFLVIAMGFFNQFSGINAILYYLNDIFASSGFSHVSSSAQAVLIGLTNLIATVLALAIIDHLGRKRLLLIGSVGMVGCLGAVARLFSLHAHSAALLWLLAGFIVFFAISQGAVIWVYISEILPNSVRSRGQSVGSSSHWITNALIAGFFPLIAARSAALPFVVFAAMMGLQFILVLLIWPETKGISLEQIQMQLHIDVKDA